MFRRGLLLFLVILMLMPSRICTCGAIGAECSNTRNDADLSAKAPPVTTPICCHRDGSKTSTIEHSAPRDNPQHPPAKDPTKEHAPRCPMAEPVAFTPPARNADNFCVDVLLSLPEFTATVLEQRPWQLRGSPPGSQEFESLPLYLSLRTLLI